MRAFACLKGCPLLGQPAFEFFAVHSLNSKQYCLYCQPDLIVNTAMAARELSNTENNIATPCSVKASGAVRRPPRPMFEITVCDIKAANSSTESRNMESSGKRRIPSLNVPRVRCVGCIHPAHFCFLPAIGCAALGGWLRPVAAPASAKD